MFQLLHCSIELNTVIIISYYFILYPTYAFVCCCRGLFSEDGKQILVVLNVNSVQVYTFNGNEVKLLVQVKASVLTKIFNEVGIGKYLY